MSNTCQLQNRGYLTRGFTLVEVFLAVAVLGFVVTLGLPLLQRFDARNNADIAETVLVGYLRRAGELARSGVEDSRWGVHASGTTVTLFRGSSFAGRVVADDTTYTLYGGGMATGADIIFQAVTGFPVASTTHVLSQPGVKSRSIHTNSLGVVQVTTLP